MYYIDLFCLCILICYLGCVCISVYIHIYMLYIYTYVAYQTLWIHRVILGYIVYLPPRRKIFAWWPLIVFGGLFRCPVMT